ncbi:hypothetical protein GCM10025865_31740 [Paraoerskovia sediminicola]|uniref:Uncharacterized protein n=1 Tax=Paraoerskovia sediminicola TaxID=1138587 RepID=A0ABN6XJR2_9CELL|nr:hypothetical protein [Paraoerskovia sediminicola]BDZ43875.1 hypothetical protein GCM10025865_31740 [Paraoerskovia sediminicola]
MSVRALLIPGSVLLVPGAAGRATVLAEERRAVADAVDACDDTLQAPGVRCLVAARGERPLRGRSRPSLGAVGLVPGDLTWASPPGQDGAAAGTAASVGLLVVGGLTAVEAVDVVEAPTSAQIVGGVGDALSGRAAAAQVVIVAVDDDVVREALAALVADGALDAVVDTVLGAGQKDTIPAGRP